MAHWYLQPLEPPQALDPLVVDLPAGLTQQGRDPAIAVATVLARQLDHVRDKPFLVCAASWHVALGRAILTQNTTGTTLGYPELITDMVNTLAAARGAQKFSRAASARICLSSVRSETARRRRSFSFSNSFRRRS